MLTAMNGRSTELTQLLKEHGPNVRHRIASRTPVRYQAFFDVDDVMQETYAQVFTLPEGALQHAFEAWLYRVAENNLKDLIRYCDAKKRNAQAKSADSISNMTAWSELAFKLLSDDSTPSFQVRRKELIALLRDEIQQLPDAYQFIVFNYDLGTMSMEQVAQELRCSLGAAFMRRNAALSRLRQRVKLRSMAS